MILNAGSRVLYDSSWDTYISWGTVTDILDNNDYYVVWDDSQVNGQYSLGSFRLAQGNIFNV